MDELDRILFSEECLSASPRFTATTMRTIRREAVRMSESRFPWLRLALGFTGGFLCVLFSAAVVLENEISCDSLHWIQGWVRPLLQDRGNDLGWAVVALIGSIIIIRLSVALTTE